MLISLSRKSLLSLYFTILRPGFLLAQTTMSTGNVGTDVRGTQTDNSCHNIADKFSVAYVTVPSMQVAQKIGHGLIENKLAACVNILPEVLSIYEWQGEINEDKELLMMIKTRTTEVDRLTEFVRSNHPYEVCEVISLPIKNGNPPYLKWIGEQVPSKIQ